MNSIINRINSECHARAQRGGFIMPSNGTISNWLQEEAERAGLTDIRIECASDYEFPRIVSAI